MPEAIDLSERRVGSSPRLGALLALVSAVLFGISTPVAKVLLDKVPPFTLAGLFYLGAALLLLPTVLAGTRHKHRAGARGLARLGLPADAKNLRYLGGAVLFGGMLGPIALLFGLRLATASSVSMLLNLETVATALLGILLFKEHLGKWAWVANAGVLTAGVLLSLEGGKPGLLGALLVAAAAVAWGFDNHFTALIDGIRPAESTFWKGLVAGLVNLGIGLVSSEQLAMPPRIWIAALVVGGLSYGLSITLYVSSAQKLGAVRAQMIFAAAPIFGVLGAVLVLGESFTLVQAAAAALIGASIWLLFQDDHGHAHHHDALTHTHEHRHDDGHHNHGHGHGHGKLVSKEFASTRLHTHEHAHEAMDHNHDHWPDLHHRHNHEAKPSS